MESEYAPMTVEQMEAFVDKWVSENLDEWWSACLFFEECVMDMKKEFKIKKR